jgi:hypothetical protein
MKLSLKVMVLAVISALVAVPNMSAKSIAAQPDRFDRSYIGIGAAAGLTNGGQTNDEATFGGNIQGRFAVPNAPVSVRGKFLFASDSSAIIPTLTYDLAIGNQTNLYAGAGYSFVLNDGKPTPIGNTDAAVLNVGVESNITKRLVVYGDALFGVNAYRNSPASALSLQAGVGFHF